MSVQTAEEQACENLLMEWAGSLAKALFWTLLAAVGAVSIVHLAFFAPWFKTAPMWGRILIPTVFLLSGGYLCWDLLLGRSWKRSNELKKYILRRMASK